MRKLSVTLPLLLSSLAFANAPSSGSTNAPDAGQAPSPRPASAPTDCPESRIAAALAVYRLVAEPDAPEAELRAQLKDLAKRQPLLRKGDLAGLRRVGASCVLALRPEAAGRLRRWRAALRSQGLRAALALVGSSGGTPLVVALGKQSEDEELRWPCEAADFERLCPAPSPE